MYQNNMFIFIYPDGTEQDCLPIKDYKPEVGHIFTGDKCDYEVESVSWLFPDSCTIKLKEVEIGD